MKILSTLLLFILISFVFGSVRTRQDLGENVQLLESTKYVLRWDSNRPDISIHPLLQDGRPLWDAYMTMNWTSIRELSNAKEFEANPATTISEVSLVNQAYSRELIEQISPEGIKVRTVMVSSVLSNGATLVVNISRFENRTVVHYGRLNYTLEPSFVKISFETVNWPFSNTSNFLHLDIEYNAYEPYTPKFQTTKNFRNINVTLPIFTVLMRFASFAIADGREVDINPYIRYSINSNTKLAFTYQSPYCNRLFYDPDFSVLVNSEPNCNSLTNCNDHGTCINDGVCRCDSGWDGEACDIAVCRDGCSGNGICTAEGTGVPHCVCNPLWIGSVCSIPDCPGSPLDCTGRGECIVGITGPKCACRLGWRGTNCSTPTCQGKCNNGYCNSLVDPPVCVCSAGFTGSVCNEVAPNCSVSVGYCSHGTCNVTTGLCDCDSQWIGEKCSIATCPGYNPEKKTANCGFLGYCNTTQSSHFCECSEGRSGPDCSAAYCAEDCSGNGDCRTESIVPTCLCHDEWEGDTCAIKSIEDESLVDDGKKKSSTQALVIAFVVIAVVAVITAIIVGLVLIQRKKKMWRKKITNATIETKNTGSTRD